ncbi:hypothetical protein E2C01_019150 [Portunus trituberculatus]|uniref:Uncharacterized protein n=1 Tax=Portunus trituberculatus TaxID=210409 RepID=A0A5B7DWG6_PORTR|nr:hypothetical protein [Portunus trituberculatus]
MDAAVVGVAAAVEEARLPNDGETPPKMLLLPAAEIGQVTIINSPVLLEGAAKVNPVDGALVVLLEPNENPANTNSFFSSLGSSGFFSTTREGVVVKVKPLRENLPDSLLVLAAEEAGAAGVVAVVEGGVAMLTDGLVAAVSLRVSLKPTATEIATVVQGGPVQPNLPGSVRLTWAVAGVSSLALAIALAFRKASRKLLATSGVLKRQQNFSVLSSSSA